MPQARATRGEAGLFSRLAFIAFIGFGMIGCDRSASDVVGPSATGSTEAKPPKGGGSTSIPATGTFGDGTVGGAISGVVNGVVAEAFSASEGAVTFDCLRISPEGGAPDFPGCTGSNGMPTGTVGNAGFTAMRVLIPGDNPDAGLNGVLADGYARQATLTWTHAGTTYRLQYGDVNSQPDPPNYAHVRCLAVTDFGCVSAVADSKEGTYDSTVETGVASARVTGPVALLLSGKGRLRPVGLYRVPFSLTVSPN